MYRNVWCDHRATGPPVLSLGPIPFLRTAMSPITSPRPAMPVEHQRPVEYCSARPWPFLISTASVVAAEIARATPEPIWKAVFSCSYVSELELPSEQGKTHHAPAQTLDFDWHTSQYGGGRGNEDERHSGYADERCSKSIDPTISEWARITARSEFLRTYKSVLEVTVKDLGMGAHTESPNPAMRRYFPFIYSRAFPVPIENIKPITPIGKKRSAVSPADRLSTCCAMRTI